MKRKIIHIDQDKCNGCNLCIPNCPEGAIQMIDGKARLISDLFCDGLGACLGHCPEGAITVEEREAEPYDERKVMENIVKQGPNTINAHLHHLKEHNEMAYLKEAMTVLKEKGLRLPGENGFGRRPAAEPHGGGCPGSRPRSSPTGPSSCT
jgi:ferredoxin